MQAHGLEGAPAGPQRVSGVSGLLVSSRKEKFCRVINRCLNLSLGLVLVLLQLLVSRTSAGSEVLVAEPSADVSAELGPQIKRTLHKVVHLQLSATPVFRAGLVSEVLLDLKRFFTCCLVGDQEVVLFFWTCRCIWTHLRVFLHGGSVWCVNQFVSDSVALQHQ